MFDVGPMRSLLGVRFYTACTRSITSLEPGVHSEGKWRLGVEHSGPWETSHKFLSTTPGDCTVAAPDRLCNVRGRQGLAGPLKNLWPLKQSSWSLSDSP